ncbi:density-regulated protein-like [Zingiber officinale]|uniref:DENR N-terminal domain-containing protein n=1 Tax=Zingiber officinale TaxID=94328 RepID=A0A8J5IEL1_ZINOF|nr:density-regulated protein-like [Zingiber officinale]KAG6534030.1 hypothetical protein ZIOFF_007911 [Zingiber officinale]
MADQRQPVRVLYCGVCCLPSEYCEYEESDTDKAAQKLQSVAVSSSSDAGGSDASVVPSESLIGYNQNAYRIGLANLSCDPSNCCKGPTEKEQIDVQGDIAYDMVEFITETWQNVPETAIFFVEGTKVAAA